MNWIVYDYISIKPLLKGNATEFLRAKLEISLHIERVHKVPSTINKNVPINYIVNKGEGKLFLIVQSQLINTEGMMGTENHYLANTTVFTVSVKTHQWMLK